MTTTESLFPWPAAKLVPLPLGAIRPLGWLRDQLRVQADGLSGHLDEFWPSVADSRWIGGGSEGWERGPYWLDGIVPHYPLELRFGAGGGRNHGPRSANQRRSLRSRRRAGDADHRGPACVHLGDAPKLCLAAARRRGGHGRAAGTDRADPLWQRAPARDRFPGSHGREMRAPHGAVTVSLEMPFSFFVTDARTVLVRPLCVTVTR